MPILLFVALAGVYLVGVAGVILVDSKATTGHAVPRNVAARPGLEERLARVRATDEATRNLPPGDRAARTPTRAADATHSGVRAIESIVRAFKPVPAGRARDDAAASGSRRPARSRQSR